MGPVHTGDKVEFNTVDFVQSRHSRPCRFGPVHTGDKSTVSGTKSTELATMSTASSYCIQVVADLSPVSATVDFVASVYRAFILINEMIVKYGQEYGLVPVFELSLVVISMGYIQEGYLPAQMCQELRYSTPNGCCKNGIQQFCDITY